MRYRRFGRTELMMPVFSCGGMRYQHKWQDIAPDEVPDEGQVNLEATIHRAVELGINHIETARGYGSSEMQLGRVLPTLDRASLIVQTKVGPSESAQEFADTFDKSMQYLRLDYVDLLSFHGINTPEELEQVVRPGGCLEVARRLQREGRVRFIGFSTHAPCSVIVSAINTGEFDYVNLHWYFVNPLTTPAVDAARAQDMGVFLISPTDKGGRLQQPSDKITELCKPLSPMQFNDLYCLSRPDVHTLSIGAARPSDFDAHVAALAHYDHIPEVIGPIEQRIASEIENTFGKAWADGWQRGLPEHTDTPGEVNIPEILRLWTYTRALDLAEWGKSRYNLLGQGAWQPGKNLNDVDVAFLLPVLKDSPIASQIPDALRHAHTLLGGDALKRQSES